MDEEFVTRAFATMGELVVSVKIVRNKTNRYVCKLHTLSWLKYKTNCPLFMCFSLLNVDHISLDEYTKFHYVRWCLNCRSSVGYCFVELADEASAERCLRKVNGKLLPRSMPVVHLPSSISIDKALLCRKYVHILSQPSHLSYQNLWH